MMHENKIPGTADAWDNRELGADKDFAKPVASNDEEEAAINAAIGLQPISIRLQKTLIEDFKLIATLTGVGYQPLMRQVLMRFVDAEKKRILREVACEAAKRKEKESNKNDIDEQITAACG